MKNTYQTKCTVPPTIAPQTPTSLTPNPTTTHEFIGAYLIQIPCPPGLKSENKKNINLINSISERFYSINIELFSKNYPPQGPATPATLNLGTKSIIRTYNFVRLIKCFPKMIWHDPVASKTMEEIDFREKAWMQTRGYPVVTGQVYYPPKSSLIAT